MMSEGKKEKKSKMKLNKANCGFRRHNIAKEVSRNTFHENDAGQNFFDCLPLCVPCDAEIVSI